MGLEDGLLMPIATHHALFGIVLGQQDGGQPGWDAVRFGGHERASWCAPPAGLAARVAYTAQLTRLGPGTYSLAQEARAVQYGYLGGERVWYAYISAA